MTAGIVYYCGFAAVLLLLSALFCYFYSEKGGIAGCIEVLRAKSGGYCTFSIVPILPGENTVLPGREVAAQAGVILRGWRTGRPRIERPKLTYKLARDLERLVFARLKITPPVHNTLLIEETKKKKRVKEKAFL